MDLDAYWLIITTANGAVVISHRFAADAWVEARIRYLTALHIFPADQVYFYAMRPLQDAA